MIIASYSYKNVVINSKSNTEIRVSIKHFLKEQLWNINSVDNQTVNLNKVAFKGHYWLS